MNQRIREGSLAFLQSFFVLFLAIVLWLGNVRGANADALPTTQIGTEAGNVTSPDLSKITFGNLPPVTTSGGMDDRVWQAGMTPDQILKLSDISSLKPEAFSLNGIAAASGSNPAQEALPPIVTQQTVRELVEALPNLQGVKIADIPPLAALFQGQGLRLDQSAATLLDVLTKNPALADLKLNAINMAQFASTAIPGLADTPIGQLAGWENSPIKDVPGLSKVPLDRFPSPVSAGGSTVMRIDMIYGPAEAERKNTISGSDVAGFAVPCVKGRKDCAYIELHDLDKARTPLDGKQWISGKYQEVEGGHGLLKLVNNGKEPTGRLPFGDVFKVVIMEPEEKTDTVSTALFFRACKGKTNCTPYFIGPVPFLNYKRDSLIIVGKLDGSKSSGSSDPTGASPGGGGHGGRYGAPPTNAQCLTSGSPASLAPASSSGAGRANGMNMDSLANAISSVESQGAGGYNAVGTHGCDGDGNCGRGLGKYQFMNYNEYASTLIAARPGGQGFLNQVAGGYAPTEADLMQYFPPDDQDRAFRSSLSAMAQQASGQIDPTTGQNFTGSRLVERVAQMHYGGPASAIDGAATDWNGALSLKDYGQKVGAAYGQGSGTLASSKANVQCSAPMSAKTCSVDTTKMDGASKGVISALSPDDQEGASSYVPYILQSCAKAGITDPGQLSYIVATAEHETDHFRTMREYDQTGYDACGAGEGMIQVTWCDGKQKVFEQLGLPAYGGIDDKRLQDPTIAADALCRGMKEGWFGQGRPISECIGNGQADYACARAQVNDHDRVDDIASYAQTIQGSLQANGGLSANSAITCTAPIAGGKGSAAGGAANGRISEAVQQMGNFSSAAGPDGGNEACAWAVNRVLQQAGVAPLGDNPEYVPSVEAALQGGRGQQLDQAQAQAGDIVIAPGQAHIGICMDNGCNTVRSNSSSRASFAWDSGFDFDGYYGGGGSHVYRITQ